MPAPEHNHNHKVRLIAFTCVQLIVVSAMLVLPTVKARSLGTRHVQPAVLDEPFTVTPLYDDPQIVSDQQLQAVFTNLRPRMNHSEPKINHVDHALRFWGIDAAFHDSECTDGHKLRQLLIDNSTFTLAWGTETAPLLRRGHDGVSVRVQSGFASSSHVDHTLATLAETGTHLSHPIITADGPGTVGDILFSALASFSLNQQEYEWTALALALYSHSKEPWRSTEGQLITFDRLGKRLMRQRYTEGVCYGNHRIFTLAVLLRVDEKRQILSPEMRQNILNHLLTATRRLVTTQSAAGWWDDTWSGRVKSDDGQSKLGSTTRRLLATGHALEWWAIAPAELHPPRDVLVRAGQWLATEIAGMEAETIVENYTVLTHAGRALALWRGETPSSLLRRLSAENPTTRLN